MFASGSIAGSKFFLERAFVTDEVVVHKVWAAPAGVAKAVQLGDHLRRRLGAGPVSDIRGDARRIRSPKSTAVVHLLKHSVLCPPTPTPALASHRLPGNSDEAYTRGPCRARSRAKTPAASPLPCSTAKVLHFRNCSWPRAANSGPPARTPLPRGATTRHQFVRQSCG